VVTENREFLLALHPLFLVYLKALLKDVTSCYFANNHGVGHRWYIARSSDFPAEKEIQGEIFLKTSSP